MGSIWNHQRSQGKPLPSSQFEKCYPYSYVLGTYFRFNLKAGLNLFYLSRFKPRFNPEPDFTANPAGDRWCTYNTDVCTIGFNYHHVYTPLQNSGINLTFDGAVDSEWLDNFLDDPVLNDCMMSDALQPVHVKSEHSYSLTNEDTQHPSTIGGSKDAGQSI